MKCLLGVSRFFACLLGIWFVSCGGGSSGSGVGAPGGSTGPPDPQPGLGDVLPTARGRGVPSHPFLLTSISAAEGAVWQLNRPIEFGFNEAVDFSSVSLNTIAIRTTGGVPATGAFFLRDDRTVVFQPSCPTLPDLSDTGLQAGGVSYVITVLGRRSGTTNTVRSIRGRQLDTTVTRSFSTTASTDPALAFLDTAAGPPVPIIRGAQSSETGATHLEIGGDPDERAYFELDDQGQLVLDPPGFEAPLNLYSDMATRVAIVIEFNQPVSPSADNISEGRLRLEFLDASSTWRRLSTRVTLVANCTEGGARVRLEPIGILPPASRFRAVILPGFQDLVGETLLFTIDGFAAAPTAPISFSSLNPPDLESDEFLEGFDFGGTSSESFQDTTALLDSPMAEWGDGALSAAFSFDGTGGPNGDFDWVVRNGEIFFFDTTATPIVGGPGGIPTTVENSVDGIVDVRNFTIQAGGEVRVQGPNPMHINATGDVRIEGLLDLSGFNAKDVATLNTGNQVESGGAGAASGGKGGNANLVTTNSSPRGGNGQGPFGEPGTGGQGGETGFAPNVPPSGKNARRPGGGGGGRFAKDVSGDTTPVSCSLNASAGTDGNPLSRGADPDDGHQPARGGPPGKGPFADDRDDNNFFGVRPLVDGGQLVDLIRGELPSLWGGYGGGGGGNADPASVFPTPGWTFASDEKGGAGGGAAGGIHVQALGRIVFGPEGEIRANGGRGGTGENTNFLDHIGGTGGGGSGGHVILESASLIDFTDEGSNVNGILRDWVAACGPLRKTGPTVDVDPDQRSYSNGGAGGGGVIQLHVPDPLSPPSANPATSDILLPLDALASREPLDQVMSPAGLVMIPTFGARSKARSKWISIGAADQSPSGPEALVRFLFRGVETAPGPDEGKLLTSGGSVSELAALLDETLEGSATVSILADGLTLELRGSSLAPFLGGNSNGISNDIYLRTPALLREFELRLELVEDPLTSQDFQVASAVYDEGSVSAGDEALRMTVVDSPSGDLQAYFDSIVDQGTVRYRLIPRFFRVVTDGTEGLLPPSAFVRLRFQAAADDGSGRPDEANPLVDWTGDISNFNALPPGALQFFRFEVEFDLDAQSMGLSADTKPVTLDFLRVPFVF